MNDEFVVSSPNIFLNCCYARPYISLGITASFTSLVSTTTDLDLPDVPTQKLFLSLANVGTLSSMSAGNLSNRPAFATTPRLTGT